MDKQNIESHVTQVTVYQDRAMVSRSAPVTLTPGAQTLNITNLPFKVLQNSVRVSGRGTARVTIVDFRLREQLLIRSAKRGNPAACGRKVGPGEGKNGYSGRNGGADKTKGVH